MRTLMMFLALYALIAPMPARPAGPHRTTPPAFSVHDLDRDGYLSRAEYAALRTHCQERPAESGRPRCNPDRLLEFAALDADRDGRIGEDELLETLQRRYRGGRNP